MSAAEEKGGEEGPCLLSNRQAGGANHLPTETETRQGSSVTAAKCKLKEGFNLRLRIQYSSPLNSSTTVTRCDK